MFHVAIIGLSKVTDFEFFREKCIYFLRAKAKEGIMIFTVEDNPLVNRFAAMYRINTKVFYPEWTKYGREAKKKRNYELLTNTDGIITFNDGTTDTEMIKNLARELAVNIRNAVKQAPPPPPPISPSQ